MSMFLTLQEVAELTGVRGGRHGKTREQRQSAILKNMKIPHYVNAAGRPIVARAVIEGGTAGSASAPAPQQSWDHRPSRAHA